MYIFHSSGTSYGSFNVSISGDIVESSEQVSFNSNVDEYGAPLRSTARIYKVTLNGNAGNVNLSVSGGSGDYRAWTAVAMY